MEILFKKYFWTVTLGFLTVSSFVGAKIVNTFVDSAFRQLPDAPPDAAGPAPAARRGTKDAAPILQRNIFNSEAKPEVAKGPDKPPPPPQPATTSAAEAGEDGPCRLGQAEETDMDIEVIALIVTDHKLWSFVQARERKNEDAKLFKYGDFIRNEARIVGIQPRSILLMRNARCEKYTMFEERPKPRATPPPAAAAAAGSGSAPAVDDKNIKDLGGDRFVIAREEVDKQLSNLNYLATQARIVPHFENGQGSGFKLFAIRPGSLYSKIGIQNGDVIKQINGETINSPDKALEAYARLKGANAITIDVVRNGQKKSLQYTIGN